MTPSHTASSAPCLEDLLEHGEFVRKLARSLVVDVHSADDLVQETWIVALRNPPRHAGALQGWLSSVVRNLARRGRRSYSRRANHEALSFEPRMAPTPAETAAERSVAREIASAVDALDPIYRDVVTMRYFDEIAPREIADRLAIPVETVRTRLKRATDRLRTRLDDEHGGDRSRWLSAVVGLAGLREAGPGGPRTNPHPEAAATAADAGARLGLSLSALALGVAVAAIVLLDPFGPRGLGDADGVAAVASSAGAASDRPRVDVRRPLGDRPTTEPPVPIVTSPAPTGLVVRGRVLGPDGSPVAGAGVRASEPGRPDTGAARVRTDARGGFVLEAVDPRAWIGAELAGHRPSRLRYASDPARGEGELTLRLGESGRVLRAAVRDRAGRPIAGASVRPVRAGRVLPAWSLDGAAELDPLPAPTVTDENGRFELAGLAAGRVPLVVEAPGHAPWSSSPWVGEDPLVVVLDPLDRDGSDAEGEAPEEAPALPEGAPESVFGPVRGRVVDDGRPLANAVVARLGRTPIDDSPTLFAEAFADRDTWTRSDPSGAFELRSVPGDAPRIALFAGSGPPVGGPLVRAAVETLEAADAPDALELDRARARLVDVSGRVVFESGEPAPACRLLFDYGLGTEPLCAAVDEASGRFELAGAPAGRVRVFAWARDLAPRLVGEAVLEGDGPLALPPFVVAPNGSVRGRVLGVEPGQRWSLRLASGAHRPFDARGDARGDAPSAGFTIEPDGRFAIEHVPAGRYTLRARSGAASSGLVTLEVRPGRTADVELPLVDGRPIELELHFPPLPGVTGKIVATIRAEDGRLVRQGALSWTTVDAAFVPMTMSLSPGAYDVQATIGEDELELRGRFEVTPAPPAAVRVVLQ